MTPAFRQLLNRFALPGFERQRAAAELLATDEPELHLREGRATFGDRSCAVQLLGSRAHESNTWRWAWAAEKGALPAQVLEAAKRVRQVGKKRAIAELAEEQFPLDPLGLDAHTLALVATGVAELPAYFRFPYSGGTLFAALDLPDMRLGDPDPEGLADVIREVVDRLDLDETTAVASYLEQRGARVTRGRNALMAELPRGRLDATFDDGGRLVELKPFAARVAEAAR